MFALTRPSLRFPLVTALVMLGATGSLEPGAPLPVAGMVWRNIGPFRAGRVSAVGGAIGEPGVFYAGFPTGGLWKTSNAGSTWLPVFDAVTTTSSIGAVTVAPSDTAVVYVGTGDMPTGGNINTGDGVYRSSDGGRTWRHVGLDDTRQVPSILVDPRDPNLVLVAAQGNFRAKSDQRGVFRSTDGGRTWSKTLFIDDQTGIERLAWAADQPSVVLAATDLHYIPPTPTPAPGGGTGPTGTALYKSTDQGLTWHELTGGGLPKLSGRISVAVAMHTHGQRMFLIQGSGLYRSDDGGTTWRQMAASDPRIATGQGGYNCGVYVSSANPDIVYTINTSSYVSTDGGNTFTGFKGAPGGDDPQQLWIDPTDGQRMLMGLDQGATVSLDGGRTWSLWYNQSTEQIYHISVDRSFPYYIYATQQDAGAIRIRNRGNYGAVGPLDWSPVGGWEWGTDIVDPLDDNVVYASGAGVQRITFPSEQMIDVGPAVDRALRLRNTATSPIMFLPWNPHQLIAGFQYVMSTTDGGRHWQKISPDLGYAKGVTPLPDTATPTPARPRGGIIECMSASTVARGLIWVGTTNGLVKLTRDEGRTWEDVSIPALPDSNRSFIQGVEASHRDPAEAYVTIDAHFAGDFEPLVFRTRDYGKTWTKIVDGFATGQVSGSFVHFVREDPARAGLLFAGSESNMYASFDDGDHWQSLQLNLPTTSFRDALIKDNDLVVASYGRGIWILDDISPLRQLTGAIAAEAVHLFKPATAVRLRRNVNQDTPFPPEVPQGTNPPDGALIYYSLTSPAREVSVDILDAGNHVVRHLSSTPTPPVPEAAQPTNPTFWLATPTPLPTTAGLNRAVWDLRYTSPPVFQHTYDINANPGRTPPSPEGPMAVPGTYTIKLTVDGRIYEETLTIRNDPRSRATASELKDQLKLQMDISDRLRDTWDTYHEASALRQAVGADTSGVSTEVAQQARVVLALIDTVAGDSASPFRFFKSRVPQGLVDANTTLSNQLKALDVADAEPTEAMVHAYQGLCSDVRHDLTAWTALLGQDLAKLNGQLSASGRSPVATSFPTLRVPVCPGE